MVKRLYYKQIGTYRNWGIFQYKNQADYIGNMKLELSVPGSDRPDLEGDISENMNSRLAAFETRIKSGSRPYKEVHSPIPRTPTVRRLARQGQAPRVS